MIEEDHRHEGKTPKMKEADKLNILMVIGLCIWLPSIIIFLYFYIKDFLRRKELDKIRKAEEAEELAEAQLQLLSIEQHRSGPRRSSSASPPDVAVAEPPRVSGGDDVSGTRFNCFKSRRHAYVSSGGGNDVTVEEAPPKYDYDVLELRTLANDDDDDDDRVT